MKKTRKTRRANRRIAMCMWAAVSVIIIAVIYLRDDPRGGQPMAEEAIPLIPIVVVAAGIYAIGIIYDLNELKYYPGEADMLVPEFSRLELPGATKFSEIDVVAEYRARERRYEEMKADPSVSETDRKVYYEKRLAPFNPTNQYWDGLSWKRVEPGHEYPPTYNVVARMLCPESQRYNPVGHYWQTAGPDNAHWEDLWAAIALADTPDAVTVDDSAASADGRYDDYDDDYDYDDDHDYDDYEYGGYHSRRKRRKDCDDDFVSWIGLGSDSGGDSSLGSCGDDGGGDSCGHL
jgi:hypothetical protein